MARTAGTITWTSPYVGQGRTAPAIHVQGHDCDGVVGSRRYGVRYDATGSGSMYSAATGGLLESFRPDPAAVLAAHGEALAEAARAVVVTRRATPGHVIRWYVYAGRDRIPHTAQMRGLWGYDATCSCGWDSHTGGATRGSVERDVWSHKWSEVWSHKAPAAVSS